MTHTYIAPKLTDLGTIRELTLGNKDGDNLDATFPVNTPKKQLLFS